MRLTSAVVVAAPQALNCLGDRELVLRNLAIPAIENLGQAKDAFDVVDFTANMISVLGDGFPPFPRLHTLYLAHNRIERIETGLAASLPNLRTLILTANRIASLDALNLPELTKLKHLEVLCIADNAVCTTHGVSGAGHHGHHQHHRGSATSRNNNINVNSSVQLRRLIINALPSLKVFNFTKVSARERTVLPGVKTTTTDAQQSESQQHLASQGNDNTPPSSPRRRKRSATNLVDLNHTDNAVDDDALDRHNTNPKKKKLSQLTKTPSLTAAQSAAVRAYIENAASVEDVTRAQQAIRDGTVVKFLASVETKDQHTTKDNNINAKENTDANANAKQQSNVIT